MPAGVVMGQALRALLSRIGAAQAAYRAQSGSSAQHPMTVVLLGAVTATHLMHAHELSRAMRARGMEARPSPPAPGGNEDTRRPGPIASDADIRDEEARVIAAYDAALARGNDLDIALISLLKRQRAQLVAQVGELGLTPAT